VLVARPVVGTKGKVKNKGMTSEADYSTMIKDFLSQHKIDLGNKSLDQFLVEIQNLQSQPSGATHIEIGDFKIVKTPLGELSIIDTRTQDSLGQPGEQVTEPTTDMGVQDGQPVPNGGTEQETSTAPTGDEDESKKEEKRKEEKKEKAEGR